METETEGKDAVRWRLLCFDIDIKARSDMRKKKYLWSTSADPLRRDDAINIKHAVSATSSSNLRVH